jgi:hypothetical protein
VVGRDGLPLLEVEAGEGALLVPLLIEAAFFFEVIGAWIKDREATLV